jgi:hypothetical protein
MHVAHIHIHLVEPTIIYNCNNDTCTYLSKYHLIDFSIHLHLASFASSVVSPALLLWITSAWISTTIHNWYTAMLLVLLYKNKRAQSHLRLNAYVLPQLCRHVKQHKVQAPPLSDLYCNNNGLCTASHFTPRTQNHQCTCLISLHNKRISLIYHHRSIAMNLCASIYITSPFVCPPTLLCHLFQQAIPTAFQDLVCLRTWETNHAWPVIGWKLNHQPQPH